MTDDLLIVAAGMGSRLKSKGDLKPLVELCGKTLIERAIETAFETGLTRAVVVTGYNSDVLTDYLNTLADRRSWHIETVFNPDFDRPNGLSVLSARELLPNRFFLTMCDHVVDARIYKQLKKLSVKDHEVALAVDTWMDNPFVDIEDVTRVRIAGQTIREIGKELTTYNAYDTGVFYSGSALFDAIVQSGNQYGDYSISGAMNLLAENNHGIVVDVDRSVWIDVDSPAMFKLAEEWLGLGVTEAT